MTKREKPTYSELIQVHVDADLHAAIKEVAARRDRPVSYFVRNLLRDLLGPAPQPNRGEQRRAA